MVRVQISDRLHLIATQEIKCVKTDLIRKLYYTALLLVHLYHYSHRTLNREAATTRQGDIIALCKRMYD